jgi:hypothetical protein
LGLGLGPRQRGAFQQAAQGGQGQQFLAARPWLQQRVNQLGPTSPQATRLQDFLATGQNQRPTPQPPGAGGGPSPWNESVGQTPPDIGVPGGPMGAQPFPFGGVPGGNMAGIMGQFSPQMQQILQARMNAQMAGGGGGGWGGGGLGGMQGQLGGMYGGGDMYRAPGAVAGYGGGLGGMQGQVGGMYGGAMGGRGGLGGMQGQLGRQYGGGLGSAGTAQNQMAYNPAQGGAAI